MSHEVPRDVTLEDDDLCFIVLLESSHEIRHSIRGILVPQVDSRVRIMERDFKYTVV